MGGARQFDNVTQNGLSFIPAKPAPRIAGLMSMGYAWRVVNGWRRWRKTTGAEEAGVVSIRALQLEIDGEGDGGREAGIDGMYWIRNRRNGGNILDFSIQYTDARCFHA